MQRSSMSEETKSTILNGAYILSEIFEQKLLKIVLLFVGDPHQLGPVIISRLASKFGMSLSLLERLMTTSPIYQVPIS